MKNTSTSLVLGLALALGGISCGNADDQGFVTARVIEDLSQGIGGPKALARPGDFVLENDQIRLAILAGSTAEQVDERHSMGPGLFGGSIIDADRQWTDPAFKGGNGRDQFAELMPTGNMNVTKTFPGSVQILQDGSDGQAAVIRAEGPSQAFITLLDVLWAVVDQADFYMVTDYTLEPGQGWVTMKSTLMFGGDGTQEIPVDGPEMEYFEGGLPLVGWAIESGAVGADFYLSGGSVDVFAPGIGFDEDGAVFESMKRGDNTFTDPFEFEFVAGVADGVSYGIAAKEGNVYVPLFTASQTIVATAGKEGEGVSGRFADGTSLSWERYFFVGTGDIGSIVDQMVVAKGIPHGTISGHVIEQASGNAVSGVDVFLYRDGEDTPYSQWETDVNPEDTLFDGSFAGRVPVGDYQLMIHDRGRGTTKKVDVSVAEGKEVSVTLEVPRPGTMTFSVRDETGRLVPSKVTLFREDAAPSRNPLLGDGFIGGSPEAVLFPMYGEGSVELRPGKYRAVASRGLEYEIDESKPFQITGANTHHVEFVVERSVNTDGWISADFHVHARPSHDSGVLLADRVRTMVCEGVEFFSSTDHDFVTDYAPVVEHLGLEEWVQTAVGTEVTTIEVGHFLGFPIAVDHLAEAGGAIDWTGKLPFEMIDGIRKMGNQAGLEPMVYVGHPRDGILGYFDQFGFNPYKGNPGMAGVPGQVVIEQPLLSGVNPLLKPAAMNWDFDALELLNGKRMDFIRTPTQPETDDFGAGGDTSVADMLIRTMEEQEGLENGEFQLSYGIEGQVDDWFSLLNLGYTFTVLGNSDTHGWTGTESGCPRNYVMAETDDPAFLDDQAIADAVKEHRVVASYGPFVQFWANGEPIGSTINDGDGQVDLAIEVQAPTWIDVDRVELYKNGALIQEWEVPPAADSFRFYEELTVDVDKDSWFVVSVMGDEDLAPVFTPVEIPYVELQLVVLEALAGVDAVSSFLEPAPPIPREYPVYPYAITNPIWVDMQGNGFDAPGLPDWLVEPVDPNDE